MPRSTFLILGALLGLGTIFTDCMKFVQENRPAADKTTESDRLTLCSPIPPPLTSSPASVHTLTPADIGGLYTLGLPLAHRNEVSRVLTRLAELISMFNPELITQHVDQTLLQTRSLLQEVEDLCVSLNQVTDWKIVFLFVPADLVCTCSPQVDVNVKTVVQEVDEALQMLQNRLHRTLVHVVVWSGHYTEEKCNCRDELVSQRLQKAILLKVLQDFLNQRLKASSWYNGVDFSVVLQSSPAFLKTNSESENTWSELNRLAIQLWTNLLQPASGPTVGVDMIIPCPTREHPFLRTQMNSKEETLSLRTASKPADPVMGTEVLCTERSPSSSTPKSVHELRPADIKVVAAVGDSLTAANGVGATNDNLLLVINEYRGLSWSIGGDENVTTVTTLPNILKEFNPSLTGFSKGVGNQNSPAASLNQAVAGARSGDMVRQVRALVDKMKRDSSIDFHNDWKVITMFIGGNDICDFCTDSISFSPRNVVSQIQQALDILHSEVPRAVVNLVELLSITPLRDLHKDKSLGCPTWFVEIVCPCVVKPKDGTSELQRLIDFNRAYQFAMRELVDSGRYDTHDNFSVILQPFFREVFLPRLEDGRPDRSYFSPDCFHLSQKAHTLMARSLWNNMLEPVGNKTFREDFTSGIDLKCPSQTNPFLRTALNSNYTFPGPPPSPPPVTNWGSDFSCVNTAPSNSVPTSVHRLRPADIKIVAALGDSITAGFGAKAQNLLQLKNEYRGVSWSIGGDDSLETVTTLPNILRKFNPDIKGVSKGIGKRQTGFNMAVSGAKMAEIPQQIHNLIITMKNDSTVNFQNDWKLVTLFIGGNDLCQYCNDRVTLSPQNYSHHMRMSLDILYKEVPRAIVNVLEILEIEGLRRIKSDSLGCKLIQKQVCPCFLLPGEDSPELAEIKRINRDVQIETEKLVYGGNYDGREDFAVVLQPFFKNTIVPLDTDGRPDSTYFSKDCFHFSERGHADMAIALWNNMLEPVGQKQTYNNFTNARNNLKCPTEEHPYIFTKGNSFPTTTSDCSGSVPAWLAAVLAIVGLLIGWVITWTVFFCRDKTSKRKIMTYSLGMKETTF
ncbi:phospholipase B1, membrane-associated isoform X2 [Nothobranchius furzeri]|uniref:Phospholipase B1 n=3 Tax=Nothobranchius furzeri TaxID=105023 RepID=A0A9D2XG99_NOTFU|nr:phospholipase B1 [Nothobranchius furzeri]